MNFNSSTIIKMTNFLDVIKNYVVKFTLSYIKILLSNHFSSFLRDCLLTKYELYILRRRKCYLMCRNVTYTEELCRQTHLKDKRRHTGNTTFIHSHQRKCSDQRNSILTCLVDLTLYVWTRDRTRRCHPQGNVTNDGLPG